MKRYEGLESIPFIDDDLPTNLYIKKSLENYV